MLACVSKQMLMLGSVVYRWVVGEDQNVSQAKGTACTKAHKGPGTENLKLGLFRKMKTHGRHDPRIFAGCLRHTMPVLTLHPSVLGGGPAGPSVPLDQVPRDLHWVFQGCAAWAGAGCSGPFTRTPSASRRSTDIRSGNNSETFGKKKKPKTQAGLSFLSLSDFRKIYWGQSEKNRSVKLSVSLLAFKSFAQHTLCVFIEKKRKKNQDPHWLKKCVVIERAELNSLQSVVLDKTWKAKISHK